MSTLQTAPKDNGKQDSSIIHRYEQQILNTSSLGVLITRISDGTILYANKATANLLGATDARSMIGASIPDFYWDEKDRLALLDQFQAEGSVSNKEMRARQADGSMIWASISLQPFHFEGEDVLLAEIVDISKRKQAEQASLENEERFRLFSNVTTEGLVFHEKGVMVDINAALIHIFGYSEASELLGKNLLDFIAPESRNLVISQMQSADPKPYEAFAIRKDGTIFPVEATPAHELYEYKGHQVRMASIRDITESKKVGDAIKESQQKLSLLIDSSPLAVIEWNTNFEVVSWNPAAERIFGYTAAEAHGKHARFIIPPEFHVYVDQVWEGLITQTGGARATNANVTKDGRAITCEWYNTPLAGSDGKVFGVSSLVEDITERKQAEDATKESQQKLSLLIDSSPLAVIEWNTNFEVVSWNPAAERIFGYSLEEAKGRHAAGLIVPAEYKAAVDDVWANLLNQTGGTRSTNGNITKDGRAITCEWYNTPLAGPDGKVFGVSSLVEDVTESKKVEEKALQLQNAVEQTGDGIALADLNGNVLYANPAWAEAHGYTVAEILGQHLSIFHTPQQLEQEVIPFNNEVMSEGKSTSEIGHRRKDGTIFPTLMTTVVQKDENGNPVGLIGTIRDITESKKAEELLQQSEANLSSALRVAQMGYWEFDIPTQMFTFNDQYYSLLSTNVEKAGGYQMSAQKFATEYVPPEDAAIVQTSIVRAIEATDPNFQTQIETRNLRADGTPISTTVWFRIQKDEQGQTVKLYGVSQDITERKRLEREVQEAFERRGYQVQVSTEISQEVAATSELSELFERVVTLTKERLGYYHTQLLRYDANQDAVVLINGYGETGRKMLASGHRMPLGSGLIGTAAASGLTVLRPSLTEDPDWQPNPLLPDTQGEIAVPIKLGEQVLGVLDIQSDQAGALTEDDRLLLEGLCGQIAIAMQSAELVKAIRENEGRLAEALKTARLANWEYDVEKDLFAFNDQFYSIFHTTAEKAGGYQLSSARYAELFVHPDDMELVGMEIGKALSSTERVYNTSLDHRFLYQDGSGVGYITVKLTVERDENGKITRYFGANQDITERIKQQNEMSERLEEINRLYQSMSREGWKSYRENAELPAGFVFDQEGTRPVNEEVADEDFARISMRVLGGEVVGTLAVANDPNQPTSPEDYVFFQQVSDQIALALEGARLSAQTQLVLAQTERMFDASRRLAQSADLQELIKTTVEMLNIPAINRASLGIFNYDSAGELESMTDIANWWNGTGNEVAAIGTSYSAKALKLLSTFLSATPVFFKDTFHDERMGEGELQIIRRLNIRAIAVLPLFLGTHQTGVLRLQAEEPHDFSQEETRLFTALAPQIATVMENRRQYQEAQNKAERESMLNVISQKIQSATTVEAVLQIAARELGHALGAPMTVAQLSMKDKQ